MGGPHLRTGIRAIVFDAVGTIIIPAQSVIAPYRDCGRRYGLDIDEPSLHQRFQTVWAQQEAIDRKDEWRTSAAREADRWRSIVGYTLNGVDDPSACFQDLWDHFARPQAWQLGPAARYLQAAISAAHTVAIASNFDTRLHSVLAGVHGLPRIDRVIVSSEVGWCKPSPHFFSTVARSTGCDSSTILFIGDDRANDYEAALAAGMRAALVDDLQ